MKNLLSPLGVLTLGTLASAQINELPGLDIELADIAFLTQQATQGTDRAFSFETTACNPGSTIVDWFAPMSPSHPFITFMITRENGDRFEQISDWSWVKHGWLAVNSNFCAPCSQPVSNQLHPNCGDTYGVGNNSNPYDLGPPDEIDPWLGGWNANGSYFDRGDPDVGSPFNTDGARSLDFQQAAALGPFVHRIIVSSNDLFVPGARYFYSGFYAVAREPEADRTNNMRSQQVNIFQSGSTTDVGGPMVGTPLLRWNGARIESELNELNGVLVDGRFYVGVKVVNVGPQLWRYEYAIHNRDNRTGLTKFEIPACPSATITNAGFKDIDRDAANDWTFSSNNGVLTWDDTSGNNKQPWNSIYNFWFEADRAPADSATVLYQANPIGVSPTIDIVTSTPTAPDAPFAYGNGCGLAGAPILGASGPASVPAPNFELQVSNTGAGSLVAIDLSFNQGSLQFQGCEFLLTNSVPLATSLVADNNGLATLAIPIAADTTLTGFTAYFQAYVLDSFGGQLLGLVNLTNGLGVPIGCN